MLRNRYDPLNLFEYIPVLSVAMDPVLAQIDILLDDDLIFQRVRADLSQRFPQTLHNGRPSTPVEVILRLLVLKHLHGWSYEQTEQLVSDSLVLRQFCRVYAQRVPDDTTLLRWANLVQPSTLHTLLDHIVCMAQKLKITHGRKLRVDGTVVETNIRYPVDSTLLGDGVRVLTRILRRAKQLVGNRKGGKIAKAKSSIFRDRTRSIRRDMKTLMDAARQRGEEAAAKLQSAYTRVLTVTQAVVAQAKKAKELLKMQEQMPMQMEEHPEERSNVRTTDMMQRLVHRITNQLDMFVPRIEQVIAQTTMRVLYGESVPSLEKIVSLFEPHTAIIRKGKLGKRVEFGRVLWLDEVEGGIVSGYRGYRVLVGSPAEDGQVQPRLERHRALFGKPPRMFAADRGVYSPRVEQQVIDAGVRHVVMPKPGAKSAARVAHERQRWFWRGRNWRSGIEGRISVLKRRHKLNRCLYHGGDGMERWVGWGVIAHDLHKIAETIAA